MRTKEPEPRFSFLFSIHSLLGRSESLEAEWKQRKKEFGERSTRVGYAVFQRGSAGLVCFTWCNSGAEVYHVNTLVYCIFIFISSLFVVLSPVAYIFYYFIVSLCYIYF